MRSTVLNRNTVERTKGLAIMPYWPTAHMISGFMQINLARGEKTSITRLDNLQMYNARVREQTTGMTVLVQALARAAANERAKCTNELQPN